MTDPLGVPSTWTLPQALRDRLGRRVGCQRLMAADGHLLLVLHAPPGAGDAERHGRFFWLQPDGPWLSSGPGDGISSLSRHLDEYASLVEELTEEEQAATGPEGYFAVVKRLNPVRRAAGNLHQVLQEAREASPDTRGLIDTRDRAYQIRRNAELLWSLTKEALEFEIALQSERLAQNSHAMSLSAHRLNVLAAFFFPIATLSSIFGMNFQLGVEEGYGLWPFFSVLAAGLCLGVILRSFVSVPLRSGELPSTRRRRSRERY